MLFKLHNYIKLSLMKNSKLTSVFILSISTLLFAVIGYYIFYSHQYKVNVHPVDYSDVIKSSEKLERLYDQLNGIEVSFKFRESEKNQAKYDDIRKMIDEVKTEIDRFNSYENMSTKEKIKTFLSLKNIILMILEIAVFIWIVFILIGIKKEMAINRRNKLVNDTIFDPREELDKFEKSAEKIREEDLNNKSYSRDNSTRDTYESSQPQQSPPQTSSDVITSLKTGLDKINEIVVNQESENSNTLLGNSRESKSSRNDIQAYTNNNDEDYRDFQQEKSEEYKRAVKEKMAFEKIKSTMDNPRVKIIIDYYRSGMDSHQIAEVTNLSRDEVEFVLRIWNNLMEN